MVGVCVCLVLVFFPRENSHYQFGKKSYPSCMYHDLFPANEIKGFLVFFFLQPASISAESLYLSNPLDFNAQIPGASTLVYQEWLSKASVDILEAMKCNAVISAKRYLLLTLEREKPKFFWK